MSTDLDLEAHQRYVNKTLTGIDMDAISEDERWHLRRRLGLGGSEAGTVLGLNKYQTPWDLWAIKTGRMQAPDLSDNNAVHFGHVLEDVVAQEYSRRTGHKVRRNNRHLVHQDYPWLVGNLDREVVGMRRLLECKTASGFAAKKGGFGPGNVYAPDGRLVSPCDEVPDTYLVQVQHYMAVTGYQEADLAVLIDGRDFRIYRIQRNDELIATMIEQLTAFWFYNVLGDVAPYGAPAAANEPVTGSAIEADATIRHLVAERKELAAAIGELETAQKEVDNLIKAYMGENEALTADGHTLATWKPVTSTRFDTSSFKKADPETWARYAKTTTTRTLRIAS